MQQDEETIIEGAFVSEDDESAPKEPSVTRILKAVGMVDDRWYNAAGRFRGSTVHSICHFELEHQLDSRTVDKRLKGYLKAMRSFVRETGYKAEACERRIRNELLRYNGKPDSWGTFNLGRAVIDFKTGAVVAATRYQLVGYAACLEFPGSWWRIAVELHANGTYNLKTYPPKTFRVDFQHWQSMVDLYHLRAELKLLNS